MRYHLNKEDARSVLNTAYLKVIENLPKVELTTLKFDSWANRIVSNALIDEYRKNAHVNRQLHTTENDRDLEFYAVNDFNEGEMKLNYEYLLALLYRLPETTRMVFNLFVIDGYSHQEISELLDIPLGTSKWQFSNAKKLLREMIENAIDTTTEKKRDYEVYRT